jgi:hypothetical protein
MADQNCAHRAVAAKVEQGKGVARGGNTYCSNHCATLDRLLQASAGVDTPIASNVFTGMPHQMENEPRMAGALPDFALSRIDLMIYGDGVQVRDVLYVEDLVNALCWHNEESFCNETNIQPR